MDSAFDLLLASHGRAAFFESYWERAPLHVSRDDASRFANLYAIADVEDAMTVGAREPEHFALVKPGGEEVPLEQYVIQRPAARARLTGRPPKTVLDARKVLAYFADGYTLVVKDASLFCARLQRFNNRLQRELGCYAQSNVYVTPSGAQGFSVHHDTHDTLTVQLEGEKTWRLYDPVTPLPLASQPFPSGARVDGLRFQREVRMRPGDTLYLPRGYPHEARSHGGRSLHCTFALAPVVVADVMEYFMRSVADRALDLRRALTPAMIADADGAKGIAEIAERSFEAAGDAGALQGALEAALTEAFRTARADASGAFDQIERLGSLGASSRLRRNDDVPLLVRDRGETVDVLVAGKRIAFPAFCRAAFEQLKAGPLRFDELDPALTPENRSALAKLLVIEGVVVID